jgi:hypothetical protein
MAPRQSDLHAALLDEVKAIYATGLRSALDEGRLPVLSALTATVYKKADAEATQIKGLLRRAADTTAEGIEHKWIGLPVLSQGIRELFDVGTSPHPEGIEDHLAHVAHVLGFASAGSLRKAKHRGAYLLELIQSRLTERLTQLAADYNFTYPEPAPSAEGLTPLGFVERDGLNPNAQRALKAFHLGRSLKREIDKLHEMGFDRAVSGDSLLMIAAIARKANHTHFEEPPDPGGIKLDIEAVLKWAVTQMANPEHAKGSLVMVGLGKGRGLDIEHRRKLAARRFGYQSGTHFAGSSREGWIFDFIRDQLVMLAGALNYLPVIADAGELPRHIHT